MQKLFSIQKRCIRLLFGNELTFDHREFYETCARTRTYKENMTPRNYCLEHTKPLFNKYKILTLENLYTYHTFMKIFKIIKYHSPISIYNLLETGPRSEKLSLILPRVNLEVSRHNFVFKSALIWNKIISIVLNFKECVFWKDCIVIPGSANNSDMSASICIVKNKLKAHLLNIQKLGDENNWT